jgi:hypothetical protein
MGGGVIHTSAHASLALYILLNKHVMQGEACNVIVATHC